MKGPVLHDDFRDLLLAFEEHGVRFVLVGAHAMAVHGVPRATGDLDLLVEPSPANAERALAALVDFGAPVEAHGIRAADLARSDTVYQLGVPPKRIDLLTTIDGISFEQAYESRIEARIDGMSVPILGRAELIRNKLATGRSKDLVDAELLQSSPDDSLDGSPIHELTPGE